MKVKVTSLGRMIRVSPDFALETKSLPTSTTLTMELIRFVLALLAIVVGLALASPTGDNLPSDPDDLDTVACNGARLNVFLNLVSSQIKPVFHDDQEVARGTKGNGDRLYVLNGRKGTITGRCREALPNLRFVTTRTTQS